MERLLTPPVSSFGHHFADHHRWVFRTGVAKSAKEFRTGESGI
jgi:hypothetical protein